MDSFSKNQKPDQVSDIDEIFSKPHGPSSKPGTRAPKTLSNDQPQSGTGRFLEKRNKILHAATKLVNAQGINGLTIVDVAKAVNLNTTSITYYFKKKDDLAYAVLADALAQFEKRVEQAGKEASPRERIYKLIELKIDGLVKIQNGEAPPEASLSDIRAIDEPFRSQLSAQYVKGFQQVRNYFGPHLLKTNKALATVRTHVFLENLFWMPIWINRYTPQDHERLKKRIFEVFDKGIAQDGQGWTPHPIDQTNIDRSLVAQKSNMANKFLKAATLLINEKGYKGASVKRITEYLNVTKGSFYHHLDAKNDLVFSCFEHSYARFSQFQKHSVSLESNQWGRLSSLFNSLLDIQLLQDFPFLRTTALTALPQEIRPEVIEQSNRIALRFAGMLIDGISEDSVRTLDPLIASQCIMAMLNSAYELRNWASRLAPDEAIYLYGSTLSYGLFAEI